MPLALSEEQRLLRDSVLKVLAESHPIGRPAATAANEGDPSAWQRAAELGWLKLALPERAGGLGGVWSDLVLIAEAFGRHNVISPFAPAIGYSAQALARTDQHAGLLQDLGDGRLLIVPALSGDLPGRWPAHATHGISGSGEVRVSGHFRVVPYGDGAQHMIVLSPDGAGAHAHLLRRDQAGVTVRPYRLMDGSPAADMVALDALAQPVLAGQEGIEMALEAATVLALAEIVGAMWTLQQLTLDYLKIRRQFGVVLSSLQALQHRLVDMYGLCQTAESAMLDGASALDATGSVMRSLRVSRAAAHVLCAGREVAEEAIQLHGGIAMTADYAVGRYVKRITVLRTSFGDEPWHRERVRRLSRQCGDIW
jgi:alkylation response protein AidB-like acyl-CoA dehydrogenase